MVSSLKAFDKICLWVDRWIGRAVRWGRYARPTPSPGPRPVNEKSVLKLVKKVRVYDFTNSVVVLIDMDGKIVC